MTTAHKPTWKPAIGLSRNKGYVPTRSYSARDLPGYLDMKERKIGQGSKQQLRNRDFKAELLQREAELNNQKLNGVEQLGMIKEGISLLKIENQYEAVKRQKASNKLSQQQQDQKQQSDSLGEADNQEENPFPEDQDSESFIKSDNQNNNLSDSQDDDEQLLREFQRVKQQRELQQRQKAQEKAKFSKSNRQSQLLKGNPLLQGGFSLTKRWYQDTVFKNQAKRADEKKSYVNDNIRSDFHRKFINKYVMR